MQGAQSSSRPYSGISISNSDRQIHTHTHTPLLNVGRSSRFWRARCTANTSTGSTGAWFERRVHGVGGLWGRGVCCKKDNTKKLNCHFSTIHLALFIGAKLFIVCRKILQRWRRGGGDGGGEGGSTIKLHYASSSWTVEIKLYASVNT